MRRLERFLVVLAAFAAGPLFSQEKPLLTPVAQLFASPQHYVGQTVAVDAVIDESNAAAGTLKLIEVKKPEATTKSPTAFLLATWSKDGVALPQKGQEVIVIGQIRMQDDSPTLQARSIITDGDAIRRFLRPPEKRPRPGDNLGHDAQPPSHLSD